jgi:leader peptidase (prepilin peptidase) / N-methyltransferase
MHIAVTVGSAALGGGVGALLPLPAYRLSMPLSNAPAAGCPHCQASLPVGIRGWIGRVTCPDCRGRLTAPPWRYVAPAALAFVLLVWRLPHGSLAEILLLAAWLVLAGAGVLLAAIDLHVKRLRTNLLAAVGAVIGSLIIAAAVADGHLALARSAGAAAVVMGLVYLTLALLSRGQLGMGDVRFAAVCGLLLGPYGWGTVVLGAILPWLLGAIVVLVLLQAHRVRRDTQIAFIPFVIAGTVLAALVASAG